MDSGSSRREVGGDTAFGDPLEFEAAGEGLEKGGLNVGAPRKKHLKLDSEPLSWVSMGTIIEEVFSDGVIKTDCMKIDSRLTSTALSVGVKGFY